jgi:hypothetical protein
VTVLNVNKKEIVNSPFINITEASKSLDIPLTTLRRYIKSGYLYKNQYYFILNEN